MRENLQKCQPTVCPNHKPSSCVAGEQQVYICQVPGPRIALSHWQEEDRVSEESEMPFMEHQILSAPIWLMESLGPSEKSSIPISGELRANSVRV